MYKLIETVEVTGQSRRAEVQEFLINALSAALRKLPRLSRLAVSLVDIQPAVAAAHEPHGYAATIEYWFDEAPSDPRVAIDNTWTQAAGAVAVNRALYRVSERVQLGGHDSAPTGERSPGVKALYLVRRPEGLSNEAATEGWRRHADTARTHHVGMSRYIQNGVIEPLTVGAPLVHGIAELSFPTLEDLEQRMYGSEEGRQAISREASVLVGEVTTLYTSEYVFGPAPR